MNTKLPFSSLGNLLFCLYFSQLEHHKSLAFEDLLQAHLDFLRADPGKFVCFAWPT